MRDLNTVTGVVKGRFDYLSPEQTRGEPATQRSDLFATGVLLYEMITGRHPFQQSTEAKTIESIKRASYVPAVAFNPEVPPAIDRLLEQTLTADPGTRFAQQPLSRTRSTDSSMRPDTSSHATLAAYRGLFPEMADLPKDPNTEADEDQETRPFLRGERPVSSVPARVDTEEMPTSEREDELPSLTLDSTGEESLKPLTSLDTSLSGFFGPIDDENTIVGQKKRDKQDWTELDTVIRPVIDTPSEAPTRAEAAATRVSAAATQSGENPIIRKRRESREPRRQKGAHPTIRRAQLLSLAIGVVIVVAALLVGFLLGNRAARLTQSPTASVSISSDPRLEVHTPEGATLSIDGREVSGTSPHVLTYGRQEPHCSHLSRWLLR